MTDAINAHTYRRECEEDGAETVVSDSARTTTAQTCYICVQPDADSSDHLIPRAFFPPPRPSTLVTLPAHLSCHNRLSEDYACAVFAGMSETSVAAGRLRAGELRRALHRSDIGGTKLRRDLIRTLVSPSEFRSPAGLLLGPVYAVRFDRNRVYPLLEKIVRGLYYYETKRPLLANAKFSWGLNENLVGNLAAMFAGSRIGLSYPDIFECRYGIADAPEMSIWWLRFYGSLVFRCISSM